MEVYKPQDTVTQVERKASKVSMKKCEDPKTLFDQVATIQNWYNTDSRQVDSDQLIAIVVKAAPDEYASVLTSEQQKQGNSLQLSNLRIVMNVHYRLLYKGKNLNKKNDDEVTLSAVDHKHTKSNQKKVQGQLPHIRQEEPHERGLLDEP